MYHDGSFITEYTERMCNVMKGINPEWTDEQVQSVVWDMIDKRGQNPVVTADNNYIGETRDTTLLSITDHVLDTEPIFAGNTTFYKNQYQEKNPNGVMLQAFLTKRKAIKKGMWQYIEKDPRKYADEDRRQGNVKKLANSYYGGSGSPSSAFYSKYSGPATTTTAQQVISTAMNLFEGFVADNYNFFDLNEVCEWLEHVKDHFEDIDDYIVSASRKELKERLFEKILYKNDKDKEIISFIVDNMDDDLVTFTFYKNNIFTFIERTDKVQGIIYDIFQSIKNLDYVDKKDPDWRDKVKEPYKKLETADKYNKFVNKTYFMDPNDPPDEIKELLDELKDIMMKYIYTPYLGFDRIYRLKNFTRKCVTVIDTDSNILSLDPLVDFIYDLVIRKETFGRSEENNMFIMINTITYILTSAITEHLLLYGKFANIPEEYRPLYSMKNKIKLVLLKSILVLEHFIRYLSVINLIVNQQRKLSCKYKKES